MTTRVNSAMRGAGMGMAVVVEVGGGGRAVTREIRSSLNSTRRQHDEPSFGYKIINSYIAPSSAHQRQTLASSSVDLWF